MVNKSVFAHLDPARVPALVGLEAQRRFQRCMGLLEETKWPLFLTGPSGSGKTIMAMNLAAAYAQAHDVPAYYVQLSPEMTKTSLILGLRLIDGSLVVADGVVADCMQTGGVIVVDEATHTTQELLLMFNSILDRTSVTSVGDRIVYAKDSFRVIFCSNDSSYAGNVRLPQSLAQRLVCFHFDHPSFEDELAIADRVAREESKSVLRVPDAVKAYVVATIRLVRSPQYPLSARNAAIVFVLLNLAAHHGTGIDGYFTDEDTAEAKRRSIAARILQNEALADTDLLDPRVDDFVEFVSQIGVHEFKEAFLSGTMYNLDIEGLELNQDEVRTMMASQVL